jgi:hypothetical protein
MKAHDLLVFNQINASLATRDKVLIKYFDKKQLFASDTQTAPTDFKGSMMKDLDKLNKVYYADMEKLGWWDKETLGLKSDADELGIIYDSEKLGVLWDNEKLGLIRDNEKLGVFWDNEKLGSKLELGTRLDSEKLGRLFDSEELGRLLDSEILGLRFTDSESLGLIIRF